MHYTPPHAPTSSLPSLPRRPHLRDVPGASSLPRACGACFSGRYLADFVLGTELSPQRLSSACQRHTVPQTCELDSPKGSAGLSYTLLLRGRFLIHFSSDWPVVLCSTTRHTSTRSTATCTSRCNGRNRDLRTSTGLRILSERSESPIRRDIQVSEENVKGRPDGRR